MKTKETLFAAMILVLIFSSCSRKNDLNSESLKISLTNGIQELNSAVNTISSSPGFQLFSGTNDVYTKSAEISPVDSLTHSIQLADIAGIYDYKATTFKNGRLSVMRFFNKTGVSSKLIVNLPEEKVKSSQSLLHYSPSDTALENNYKISVSDYLYKFNFFGGYDYNLASAINIKGTDAGNLKIQSKYRWRSSYTYLSEFNFPEGYTTSCQYTSGDTITSSYSISKDAKKLYEEKLTAIKTSSDKWHREKEFSLLIGNVLIVRNSEIGHASLDSAKVYVSGVLQLNSKVEIVDASTDLNDQSVINQKREVKITFDDGTSATLSEMAGDAINNIGTLFTTMRQVNFATRIVDWIAWDIYSKR